MTTHRFRVDEALRSGASGVFTREQARQLRTVLRLVSGSPVRLFNTSGVEATAIVTLHGRAEASWEVEDLSWPEREPPIDLTVGLALLRGDRFEMAIQKLTEIGVARLVPLEAERSVVSFDVARDWERKIERFSRITIEAEEQSERVFPLLIDQPVQPARFFQRQPTIVLAERREARPLASIPLSESMAIAIGPEGGWSEAELAEAERSGATMASLGRLIYRAESAAIVAAGVLAQRAWAAD
jgi:16S rRNA (uracil1498-N3)-methyltransferase